MLDNHQENQDFRGEEMKAEEMQSELVILCNFPLEVRAHSYGVWVWEAEPRAEQIFQSCFDIEESKWEFTKEDGPNR